jgi:hypothetical protein
VRSSGDVVPTKARATCAAWSRAKTCAGEPLSKPYAVAATRGRIFVSDTVSRFVRLFDVPAGKQHRIGDDEGPGQLIKPIGLDVDGAGRLYVADIGAKAVMVYGPTGQFLRKIGGDKWFSRLSSVTVDPTGSARLRRRPGRRDLRAAPGAGVRRRQRRAPHGHRQARQRPRRVQPAARPGHRPRRPAVRGGRRQLPRRGVRQATAATCRASAAWASSTASSRGPRRVAADREGNVYVVDAAFGNFQIFNPEGELLLFVGDRSERDGPARYMLPSGIAVDEDGRVYVVDQWFRKIDIYRPAAVKPGAGFLARRAAATPVK